MMGNERREESVRTTAWLIFVLLVVVGWVFWPTIEQMARRWSSDPQYTHGYVVPVFAALVLWLRRDGFPRASVRPAWWGLGLVVLGGLMRLAGAACAFEWLEAGALIPCLAGLIVLASGPAVLRWSWPAGAFLIFILPWPWQFDVLLTYPLQQVATRTSTYALQTLGVPAVARGNIIVVNNLEVGVVEACSGLGMLMTFFALSTAVAFVIQRPLRDRIILFLSAAPVGVLMNVIRITVTVFLYQWVGPKAARIVFHDVAGWVMMPMALVVLWLELLFLDRLWLPVEPSEPAPAAPPRGSAPPVFRPVVGPAPQMTSLAAEPEHSLQEIRDVAY